MTLRALIVDDNPSNAMVVEFILEKLGLEYASLHHPEDVMEHLKTCRYDVMLLDWMMPNIDGIELLRTIRAKPEMASLKVIMCTARSGDSDRQTALNAGADAYLPKPLSLNTIRESLRGLELLSA
jgi:CheY-like chemotaxis protein